MDRRPFGRELEARFGSAQFQQLLQQLATQAGGAVFVVDAQNTVLYWSSSAEREFGRSAPEMLGRHCLMGISCTPCLTRCALAADAPPEETRIKRADGTLGAYRRSVFRMHADDGSYVGGVELLVPVEATVAHVDGTGIASFGSVRTSDPRGQLAIGELFRVRLGAGPVFLVSDEPGARLAIARELSRARSGPFLLLDPWDPEATRKLASADGGTLFVDELASAGPVLQIATLRACARVDEPRAPRVIAGGARTAHREVRSGRLRSDLGAILAIGEVRWPDLTERPFDVERITDESVRRWGTVRRPGATGIEQQALDRLKRRRWVGGEPELRAAVEAACLRATGTIREADLPAALIERGARPPDDEGGQRRASAEARRIQQALAAADGNVSKAAEALGVGRTTLYRRRRKLGI